MIKPEWGTKRTCPKCGTRFYDLGNEDPVTCIECGTEWNPDPILKSKQPLPFEEQKKPDDSEKSEDTDLESDLDLDDTDDGSPDDDVDDLGGNEDIGVNTSDDEDENN